MRRLPALVLLALLASPARADITLAGSQHIGDGEDPSFTPRDPVERAQMQASPTNFWLTQAATITAVRLDGVADLDGKLQVFIDDMNTPLAGTLSGGTYTLASPLTLAPGAHTLWPDGGCSLGGFALPCVGGENDFGFDSITLVSPQTTLSRHFNQRRHLGDTNDANNDYVALYPDRAETRTLQISFTLTAARMLSQVRFHRVRGIPASMESAPTVVLDEGGAAVAVGSLTNGALVTFSPAVPLSAATHTLTIHSGVRAGPDDNDFSWDDLILVFTSVGGSVAGDFNAVAPGEIDVTTGQITTKTAGDAFALDLVALSGGLLVGYTGTVSLELVDAASASGSCTSWPQAASLGSVTFTAADAGRKNVSLAHANALADARIRINDTANAVTSCSYDNFAIKPSGFGGITVSHNDPATPGTAEALATSGFAPATMPVHKAGRYFTVQAYARNSAGAVTTAYAGSPEIRASAALAGMGAVLGNASATGWSYPAAGYLRTDAAQYDEVGAVTLELVDTTFAAVDVDDTGPAARAAGPSTFSVGRFVPDHFTFAEVVPAEFAAACGPFTYVGQPFGFPNAPSARVTAVAAGGTPTKNYTDTGLYRISLAGSDRLPQSVYAAAAGAFNAALVPVPDNSFVNEGNGTSLLTLIGPVAGYAFARGAPAPPFAAEITITPSVTDLDGVTFGAATPGRFGDPAAGGIPFAGGNEIRYGRLVVANAQGSELLPLAVPLQAEYVLANNSGFARNLADNCSTLAIADITLSGSLAGPPDPPGDTSIQSIAGGGGLWTLTLTAPGDPGQVPITANIAATRPWLLTDDTDADANYDDAPAGLATFGLAGGDERRIFLREVIGF